MKYRCPTKKETIVSILVEEFNRISADYQNNHSDPILTGRYREMVDLLQKIKIYEEEE